MPVTCIVPGCRSRGNRKKDPAAKEKVSFYRIPMVFNYRFLTQKNDLSSKRRTLWLEAINRDGLTYQRLKNQRVCNKHFITGKPAKLEDENDPDWVPSQNMGGDPVTLAKRKDVRIKEKSNKKSKRRKLEVNLPCIKTGVNIADKNQCISDSGGA